MVRIILMTNKLDNHMDGIEARAKDFIENERQFHLGFLPTEQSNPKTRDMDRTFAASTAAGVRQLLSVDRDIVPMARRVFASPPFHALTEAVFNALASGGRYVSVDDGTPDFSAAELARLAELVDVGAIAPVIDRVYPLERIVEAHRYVEADHKRGNVVVTIP